MSVLTILYVFGARLQRRRRHAHSLRQSYHSRLILDG